MTGTRKPSDTGPESPRVDRLRVIDASIMPTIVSGNTNAAVMAAAGKAAGLILA